MFFISCFRKKKINKEVRRMQCECTLDPGQIMALMHRLHYMLNMVMCILQYVNLATHCWGLLNHIFWDKLSITCPMPFYGIKQIDSSNKFHIYIEVQTSVTHSAVPCVLLCLVLTTFQHHLWSPGSMSVSEQLHTYSSPNSTTVNW